MLKHKNLILVGAATLVVCLLGCTSELKKEREKYALLKFGLRYHEFFSQHRRSPKDLAEFKSLVPALNKPDEQEIKLVESTVARIEKGEIIVIWNAAISEDGEQNDNFILAYETQTPKSGGLVLNGGGSTQHLSPEEFANKPLMETAKPSTK